MPNNEIDVYQKRELTTDQGLSRIAPSQQRMLESLGMADIFVRMQHLSQLENAAVVPLPKRELTAEPRDRVRLLHFSTLNYDSGEDVFSKLSGVFSAVSAVDCSAVFIVHHDGVKTDVYMGTACSDTQVLTNAFETMRHAVDGHFPGCKSEQLFTRHNEKLLNTLFDSDQVAIASVSSMASVRGDKASGAYLQGIEKLVDGMRGQPFALVVLASSVAHETLARMRNGYETLYTQLTPFYKTQQSLSETDTINFSKTIGDTVTQSVSLTSGTTANRTRSGGTSTTESKSKEEHTDKNKKAEVLITAATLAGMVGSAFLPGLGSFGPMVVSSFGSNVSKTYQTLAGGKSNASQTTSTHKDESESEGTSDSKSTSDSTARSTSTTDGNAQTKGATMQYHYENKAIGNILEAIDVQLDRIKLCEGGGAYQCAAYILAADNATARMCASIYRSLLTGYSPDANISYINVWNEANTVSAMSEYLKRMLHPAFSFSGGGFELPQVTPATLSTAQEMSVHVAWPRKALPGVMVDTHAEFARDIIKKSDTVQTGVKVGHIVHMGNVEDYEVEISLEELSKHMFISGTTGSGKSNMCYVLLNRLMENGIKFLVIEPAKGEYARVFGGRSDVRVFGTNKAVSPLLTINPFAFPKGIHVLEHIDRLLGVFNASWPMYAAMPEFLKEAIELSYRECGWDLDDSVCRYSPERFPTFVTLAETLPRILKQTEFSQEVQGNYIGALVTRVKSMANGICGQLFCRTQIPDEALFDSNAIIDISRLGSSETKSLIMGMLIIRLQEHRMTRCEEINSRLKHVTLLEEAHHLLKAASGSQSMESANLQGMSVEILTNAIAEMRTYGESFIIADQSPSVMDRSVIRNTNTKVVFKLPDEDDRRAVGKAMGLNPEQIGEIARLDTGVAVMHQGNWLLPVLCMTEYFSPENYAPYIYEKPVTSNDELRRARGAALEVLVSNRTKAQISMGEILEAQREALAFSGRPEDTALASVIKRYGEGTALEEWSDFGAQCRLVSLALRGSEIVGAPMDDIAKWNDQAIAAITARADADAEAVRAMIGLILMHAAAGNKQMRAFYYRWYAYTAKNAASKLKKDKDEKTAQ